MLRTSCGSSFFKLYILILRSPTSVISRWLFRAKQTLCGLIRFCFVVIFTCLVSLLSAPLCSSTRFSLLLTTASRPSSEMANAISLITPRSPIMIFSYWVERSTFIKPFVKGHGQHCSKDWRKLKGVSNQPQTVLTAGSKGLTERFKTHWHTQKNIRLHMNKFFIFPRKTIVSAKTVTYFSKHSLSVTQVTYFISFPDCSQWLLMTNVLP